MTPTPKANVGRHIARRKKDNPILVLLGLAVFVGALVYSTVVVVQFQSERQKIAHHYRTAWDELESQADAERSAFEQERREWADNLRRIQQENLQAKQRVQMAERKLEESRRELGERESEKQRALRQVEAQAADQELVGEGVEELRRRGVRLRNQREALTTEFKAAYVALKEGLRQLVAQKNPDRVRQFFFTNRSTAVGPAAAFFAADMYYEKKQTKLASQLYDELVKRFPDSPYTAKAQRRLGDIEARLPYDTYDQPRFQPYKIPDSLDFGEW